MKNTPQTHVVLAAIHSAGHATNAEIHEAVLQQLPNITLPSIHRITARLAEEGLIGIAPVREGVTVLDMRSQPHHHFVCRGCWKMRDIEISTEMVAAIARQLPKEIIDGGFVIYGSCKDCSHLLAARTPGSGS
jgi:Fur family peroxide stress response transcriptional regulator